MAKKMTEAVMTIDDLAHSILKLSTSTLYKLLCAEEVCPVRKVGRHWRFPQGHHRRLACGWARCPKACVEQMKPQQPERTS